MYNTLIRFDGDIIITDPCYIINNANDDKESSPDIRHYLSRMSCKTVDGQERYIYPEDEDYPDCRPKTLEDCKGELARMEFEMDLRFGIQPMYSPTLRAEMEAYYKDYDDYASRPHDDWDRCNYGEAMERLGLTTFLCDSTIYGDWSCTTFDSDTKKEIGKFCADAGMVGVFLLDEVLKYNPDFDYHINRKWTTTLIKDFHGTVELHCDEDRNGDKEVTVVGKGNINFIGTQTGL